MAGDRRFSDAVKAGIQKDERGQQVWALFRRCCADAIGQGVTAEAIAAQMFCSTKNLEKMRSASNIRMPNLLQFVRLLSLGSPVPDAVKVRTFGELASLLGFTPAAGRAGGDVRQEAIKCGAAVGGLQAVVARVTDPASEEGELLSMAERAEIDSHAGNVQRAAASVAGSR